MKVLLSLSLSCITLALCQAECFTELPKAESSNGVLMPQDGCIDPYDGSKHPSGSEWNTDKCMTCSCKGGGMTCCSRYGGVVADTPGCKSVLNPATCQYEAYQMDNPLEPCVQFSIIRY